MRPGAAGAAGTACLELASGSSEHGALRWPPCPRPADGLYSADELKPIARARLLCGQQLARELDGILARARALWTGNDHVECLNRPGPPYCKFGVDYETTTFT